MKMLHHLLQGIDVYMTRIWEMWSFAIRYETQDAKNSFCSSGSHASIIYCILRAVISAQTPLLKAKGSVLTEWWWYDKELWMKQVHLFVPKSPLVREHISHIMLQCVTPWWFSVFVHWTKQLNSDIYLNPCVLSFYSHRLIHITAVVTIWFREEVKCSMKYENYSFKKSNHLHSEVILDCIVYL